MSFTVRLSVVYLGLLFIKCILWKHDDDFFSSICFYIFTFEYGGGNQISTKSWTTVDVHIVSHLYYQLTFKRCKFIMQMIKKNLDKTCFWISDVIYLVFFSALFLANLFSIFVLKDKEFFREMCKDWKIVFCLCCRFFFTLASFVEQLLWNSFKDFVKLRKQEKDLLLNSLSKRSVKNDYTFPSLFYCLLLSTFPPFFLFCWHYIATNKELHV